MDVLNLFLVRNLHVLGTRITFSNPHQIDKNQPIIIVANHQSLNDIPALIWFMRKHHVKFISKKELGKGIPSVSYNLRHGGSVLIERKKPLQALHAIKNMANYIETHHRAVVIFPEGTRSRDGQMKPFKTKGLEMLLKHSPNGLVVPIAIHNSWKTLRYGKFPLGIGTHIKFEVLEPLEIRNHDISELITTIESQISNALHHD